MTEQTATPQSAAPSQVAATGTVERPKSLEDVAKLMGERRKAEMSEVKAETPEKEQMPETEQPGTQEAEANGEPGAENQTQEAENSSTEELYTVKVGGEEDKVTLEEMRRGYQRERDYTRKTEELGKTRQKFESEKTAFEQQRLQATRELGQMGLQLERLLQEQAENIDWEDLRKNFPDEYAAKKWDFEEKRRLANIANAKAAEAHAAEQQERQKRIEEWRKSEAEKLKKAIPEFQDEEKGRALEASIRHFLSNDFAFGEDELSSMFDHRLFVIANEARLYRNLKRNQDDIRKEVKKAPNMMSSGPAKASVHSPSKAAYEKAREEMKKNPSFENSAKLMALKRKIGT